MKLKKVVIVTGIILLLGLLALIGWSILLSMLNTNAFGPKIKLTQAELDYKHMLTNECDCRVDMGHSYELVTGNHQVDTPLAYLSYTWYYQLKEGELYVKNIRKDDLCFKDSATLLHHSQVVAEGLYDVMQYKEVYKGVRVHYSSYYLTPDLRLTASICLKQVTYLFDKHGALILHKAQLNN